MKTALIEYTPLEAPHTTPLNVFRYIKKCILENQAHLETKHNGERLRIHLKGQQVAVIEVRR